MSSRLRDILLANRRDPQMAEPELCPFCQNKNPNCQYFELGTVGGEMESENDLVAASGNLGDFPEGSFWGRVKQALIGTMISFNTEDEEFTFDLGESMKCGYYYLDLFGPWAEMPLIAKIAKKFGFSIEWDGKNEKFASHRFIAVPVSVLQPSEVASTTFDDGVQDRIDLEYMSAMDNAATEFVKESYWDYDWMPLYFEPSKKEVNAPDKKRRNKPNLLALVNWRTIYSWEETIYRIWADMEERLILEPFAKDETKRGYECNDLLKARNDFIKEYTEIQEKLK